MKVTNANRIASVGSIPSIWSILSVCLLVTACQDSKTPMPDASTDTDSDSDTDTETDTGEPDWGDTIPCSGEKAADEICVPGGKYLLGCVPGDNECEDYEKPLVLVNLSPFFIEKYEAQFGEVIDFLNDVKDDDGILQYDNGITWTDGTENHRIWSLTYNDMYPVQKNSSGEYEFNWDVTDNTIEGSCPLQGGINGVASGFSWLGAKMYCEWKGMTLPSEAQWEAAARGHTLNKYPCGTDITDCFYGYYDCCNGECTNCDCLSCCYPFSPAKAGGACPSPLGVNGMYGNAYEWVADIYDEGHAWADGLVDPVQSDETANECGSHVAKGGCVASLRTQVRISSRGYWSYISDVGGQYETARCVRLDEAPAVPDAGVDAGK